MPKFDLQSLPERPDLSLEQALWSAGIERVGGIDEAGRGAWAGPVAAAVVVLPPAMEIYQLLAGVRDSKQMSPAQRDHWAGEIKTAALAWSVSFASNREIDELGILPATRLAAQRALAHLPIQPDHLLVDYLALPEISLPQTALVKGDARSLSIAAASVLAKTARDALMIELDRAHPGYGFARHKGYGTAAHREALLALGLCPLHRASYEPVGDAGARVGIDKGGPV
jgi:ribonuclease HII